MSLLRRIKAAITRGTICYKDDCYRKADALVVGERLDEPLNACSPHAMEFMLEQSETFEAMIQNDE